MLKVTKAVFPVAGLGTRFLPATKASPLVELRKFPSVFLLEDVRHPCPIVVMRLPQGLGEGADCQVLLGEDEVVYEGAKFLVAATNGLPQLAEGQTVTRKRNAAPINLAKDFPHIAVFGAGWGQVVRHAGHFSLK